MIVRRYYLELRHERGDLLGGYGHYRFRRSARAEQRRLVAAFAALGKPIIVRLLRR